MIRTKLAAVIVLFGLLHPLTMWAFETDQYNLSPEPLADISDEVEAYVRTNLAAAVSTVNDEISQAEKCLSGAKERGKTCPSNTESKKKLAFLISNAAVPRALYKRLGEGNLFTTKFDKWIKGHKFEKRPWSYKTGFKESIYKAHPLDFLTISPTIRLYGSEFGIDKLDHLFQQGHQYYEIRNRELLKGSSETQARRKAIDWGTKTERTYFGLLVSGVYSNGDLYANYAGMKFYIGLTEPQAAGKNAAPVVSLEKGRWQISSDEPLLKPFIADHMNEALNPSGYAFNLIRSVRRAVSKYACPDWRRVHPDLSPSELEQHSRSLETWHGEDYGFTRRDKVVRIWEVCFQR
jgi:hypothetical protein